MDIFQSLLLAFSFIGVLVALVTKYVVPGLVMTLIGFFTYFYLIGLDAWFPLFLFVIGLLLIVLEVFIPDFGILGIIGLASFVGGLYLTAGNWTVVIQDVSIALIITFILTFILVRTGMVSDRWDFLVLKEGGRDSQEEISENTPLAKREQLEVGSEGMTITPLRPTGFAKFNIGDDEVIEVDVTSEIEALEAGQKVRIERIQGNKITVRRVI